MGLFNKLFKKKKKQSTLIKFELTDYQRELIFNSLCESVVSYKALIKSKPERVSVLEVTANRLLQLMEMFSDDIYIRPIKQIALKAEEPDEIDDEAREESDITF